MEIASSPPFSVTGEGPPLVLIAGFGQAGSVWEAVLPRLTRHFTCYVFDNRGVGVRAEKTSGLTLDVMADDVAAIIRSTATGRAAVLGWSMGGAIAQRLALEHPDLVDALVLVGTMARRTQLQQEWTTARIALARSGVSREAAVVAGLPWLFTAALLGDHSKAMVIADGQARVDDVGADALHAQAAALDGFDSRAELGTITCPALVLVGAEDVLTPVDAATELFRALPNADLIVLPRGGHGAVLEMPNLVFPPIVRFLRQCAETHAVTPDRRDLAALTDTRS